MSRFRAMIERAYARRACGGCREFVWPWVRHERRDEGVWHYRCILAHLRTRARVLPRDVRDCFVDLRTGACFAHGVPQLRAAPVCILDVLAVTRTPETVTVDVDPTVDHGVTP